MKTSELIGPALDWAVAKAQGWTDYPSDSIERGDTWHLDPDKSPFGRILPKRGYCPSTNWSQGGPIIERELIGAHSAGINFWKAGLQDENSRAFFSYGPTPLIAAMRCLVASKLGDEVELPDELK